MTKAAKPQDEISARKDEKTPCEKTKDTIRKDEEDKMTKRRQEKRRKDAT